MTLERGLFIARRVSIGFVFIGVLLKILHLPYAGMVLSLSLTLLALNHFVLAFVLKLPENYSPFMVMLFRASCIFLGLSFLRIWTGWMHYPYTSELILGGSLAFFTGIAGYFYKPSYGKKNITVKRIHIAAIIFGGLSLFALATLVFYGLSPKPYVP